MTGLLACAQKQAQACTQLWLQVWRPPGAHRTGRVLPWEPRVYWCAYMDTAQRKDQHRLWGPLRIPRFDIAQTQLRPLMSIIGRSQRAVEQGVYRE